MEYKLQLEAASVRKKKATPAEKVTLSQQFAGALIKRFECILAFYVKTYIQAQIYTYIKKKS